MEPIILAVSVAALGATVALHVQTWRHVRRLRDQRLMTAAVADVAKDACTEARFAERRACAAAERAAVTAADMKTTVTASLRSLSDLLGEGAGK